MAMRQTPSFASRFSYGTRKGVGVGLARSATVLGAGVELARGVTVSGGFAGIGRWCRWGESTIKGGSTGPKKLGDLAHRCAGCRQCLGVGQLSRGQSARSAAHPAARPGSSQASHGAFVHQRALELGQGAEHVQHQTSCGACGVDLFGQLSQTHIAGGEISNEVQQIWQRASQPVQSAHHHRVTCVGCRNKFVERRAMSVHTRGDIGPHPRTASGGQSIGLTVGGLIGRRYPCISQQLTHDGSSTLPHRRIGTGYRDAKPAGRQRISALSQKPSLSRTEATAESCGGAVHDPQLLMGLPQSVTLPDSPPTAVGAY